MYRLRYPRSRFSVCQFGPWHPSKDRLVVLAAMVQGSARVRIEGLDGSLQELDGRVVRPPRARTSSSLQVDDVQGVSQEYMIAKRIAMAGEPEPVDLLIDRIA